MAKFERLDKRAGQEFQAFFEQEYDRVYRAAYLFSGDRGIAEDASQEAFSRAYSRWRTVGRESWRVGWVIVTCLNLCKRLARSRPRSTSALKDEVPATTGYLEGSILRMDVLAALRRLPERQRHAVVLHYLGDLPVTAAADLMGISEGAIKSHLSRARSALRVSLKDHAGNDQIDSENKSGVKGGLENG